MTRTSTWLGVQVALASIGTLLAIYLTYLHFVIAGNESSGVCSYSSLFSCDSVLASGYSEILGIPVAILGLAGFGSQLALGGIRFLAPEFGEPRHLGRITLVIGAAGVLFGVYLTLVEAFALRVFCPYCLSAFAIQLLLLLPLWMARHDALEELLEIDTDSE